jgi:tetraacyldisaccharide 4'-kinase
MRALATGAASLLWSSVSWGARVASRGGVLGSEKLDAGRVISVGNLQAGGAGKTPLVARIANEAAARGMSVCVLCRGYGGEWELGGGVLAPGAGVVANAMECGDEAALLGVLAPSAWIGVGADRCRQYERVVVEAGKAFDLVVLDDGFQHWKIKKDLEIVALTSHGPTDTLFRDFPGALESADLLVWTKGMREPRVPSGKPLIRIRFELPPTASPGMRIWLVTGVGDNAAALESATQAGYRVERHLEFRDHAVYEAGMILDFIARSREAGCSIAVTGKDWVKWRESAGPEQVMVLEPEIRFEDTGFKTWNRVLWGRE